MITPVTPIYAAFLAIIFIFLSVRTLLLRRRFQVAVGDGNEIELKRAARAHANFSEYVPLTLLLVFFFETMSGTDYWIHAICLTLIMGRLIHAYGLSQTKENLMYRVAGMACTFTALGSASLRLIILYFFQ